MKELTCWLDMAAGCPWDVQGEMLKSAAKIGASVTQTKRKVYKLVYAVMSCPSALFLAFRGHEQLHVPRGQIKRRVVSMSSYFCEEVFNAGQRVVIWDGDSIEGSKIKTHAKRTVALFDQYGIMDPRGVTLNNSA